MKRFIGFLSTFLLLFTFLQNVTALVLDDVTIDENVTVSKNKNDKTDKVTIRFHNYPDDITDNLRLTLNQEEIFKPDYTLTGDRITRYYYILIDNSGSIQERDLNAIRKNVSYLISHINPHDYVEVITVSDYSSAIYNLSHYNPNVLTRIDGIVREGNYSRLYDAVSELNTQVLAKQSADTKKASQNEQQSLYYILFFSDGEDIESRTTGRQMKDGYRDIPFYYFCYSSNFKAEPNKPFQDIADKHGKFFNYLDTEKIDELFFRNENRYTLIFFVNKKEVLKTKSYYIELSKRTTEEGKIIIDLRKYFDGNNLNDMIVDAPKDQTIYNNLKNNLAHDTQVAYKYNEKSSDDDKTSFTEQGEGKSSDDEKTSFTESNQSERNEKKSSQTNIGSTGSTNSETKNIDDKNRESSMTPTSASSTSGNRKTSSTEPSQSERKQEKSSDDEIDWIDNSDNNAEPNINTAAESNSTDNQKTTNTAAVAAGTAAAAVGLTNSTNNETKKSSSDEKNSSTESNRSKQGEGKSSDDEKNSLTEQGQSDQGEGKSSDNEENIAESTNDSSDDNAAAVIVPAKTEKQKKQPKQNKTVKEKTNKETKQKSDKDNKWWIILLIILLILLLLLLLLWLIWWLIGKIRDSRQTSSGGGRSSGGIDRTPVETYSPPPTPVSSSSSAAKKPAAKPTAKPASNKVKFRIAKDSYRKGKNRIDNTKESGIPTFIEEMNKDEGKLKVGSAVTIAEIHDDHITAQSVTGLQPDDIVTINKTDFLVVFVRYRSKVYTFDLVPLDPNFDIRKNVKMTDSVTMAEKTVAVYGSKESIINKMLAPSKVEIVTTKWSDGTIDAGSAQTDKMIHSDSPLYLDYIVEIQQGVKTMQYLITEVKYENRKYTGKIKPL